MVETLRELIEVLRSSTHFEDHRALVEALERIGRRPDPTTMLAVITAARRHSWWHEVTKVLPKKHVREAVRVVLPGLNVDNLDVRMCRPRRHIAGWQGDLYVTPDEDLATVSLAVGSLRAAVAVSEMTRQARARISSIVSYALDDKENDAAIEAVLSTLHFDGVTSIRPLDPEHAVAMVLRCPALAEFFGPITRDVVEALETSAVSTVHARSLADDALPLLARVPFLNKLSLPYDAQVDLSELTAFPGLIDLSIPGRWLDNEHVVTLARIAKLERLMIHGHPISDASPLANLTSLRALDLHDTKIRDSTLNGLATLPVLVELDVLGTPITPAGISAFKGSSLKRIGLSWKDDNLVDAAHAAGLEVVTDSSEGLTMGGAIWSVAVPGN